MNVTVKLKATPQEIYGLIQQSLIAEFPNGVELRQGAVYEKSIKSILGQNIPQTVKILDLEKDKSYKAEFSHADSCYTVSYQLTASSETETDVFYEQTYMSGAELKQWNYRLLSKFYEKGAVKKLTSMLKQMESHIITNRKES